MKKRIITVLHGTNYWNIGDLGLMEALLLSLNREFKDAQICIMTAFSNIDRPSGQKFNLNQYFATEIEGPTSFRTPYKTFLGKLFFLGGKSVALVLGILLKRFFNINLPFILSSNMQEMLNIMCDSELIISKPGGFLYDVKESRMPMVHHLFPIFLSILSGRPVVIYAQSIGPFDRKQFHWLIRMILSRTSLILVRDEPSLNVCNKVLALKRPNIHITADEAFLLPKGNEKYGRGLLKEIGIPEGVDLVGMTILDWHFPNAQDKSAAIKSYVKSMVNLLDHINHTYNTHVVMFPFVLAKSYVKNGDEIITKRLYKACAKPNMVHLFKGKDPSTIKSIMSLMKVFVGSRMHSNIFALSSGIPVLAISYLPKTKGIMNMLGLSDFVLNIDNLTTKDLIDRFDKLWALQGKLCQSLPEKLDLIREKALENGALSRKLVENRCRVDSRKTC